MLICSMPLHFILFVLFMSQAIMTKIHTGVMFKKRYHIIMLATKYEVFY